MKSKSKGAKYSTANLLSVKSSEKLYKQITTKKTWKQLNITTDTKLQFNNINDAIDKLKQPDTTINDVNNTNYGYKILFTGSAKGKKLAAKLIGNQHSMDVYKIDLSQVVSKYIGETEKNLTTLFNAAEEKNWILFFDEADALFGKRTDVKDAHDRYANQQVSYLLQRIEQYNGIIILDSEKKNDTNDEYPFHINTVVHFKSLNNGRFL